MSIAPYAAFGRVADSLPPARVRQEIARQRDPDIALGLGRSLLGRCAQAAGGAGLFIQRCLGLLLRILANRLQARRDGSAVVRFGAPRLRMECRRNGKEP